MPEELPLDASWDTIYRWLPSGTSGDYIDELPVYQGRNDTDLTGLPDVAGRVDNRFPTLTAIATSIVDAVGDTVIDCPLEDILEVWAMKRLTSTKLKPSPSGSKGLIRVAAKICVTVC